MSDSHLPRLAKGDDPLVCKLLAAAIEERPQPIAVERALRTVAGSFAAAGIVVIAPAKAAATSAASSTSTALASGSAVGVAALLKWGGVGLLAGFISVGALARFGGTLHRDDAARSIASTARTRDRVIPMAPVPTEKGGNDVVAVPSADPQLGQSARVVAPALDIEPKPTSAALLAEETRTLERARALLRAGNAAGAIASLGDYDQRFARKALEPEALLLRMEAQMMRGDSAAARRAGEAIIGRFPKSPQVTRARAFLESPGGKESQ